MLFDLVGSGNSDRTAYDPTKYASLRGYADDLLEIVEEFGAGPSIFIGHSVSQRDDRWLADVRDRARFAAQIMIGPSPCYLNDGDCVGGFTRSDIDSLLETVDSNDLGWSREMAPVIMGRARGARAPRRADQQFLPGPIRRSPSTSRMSRFFPTIARTCTRPTRA